MFRRDESSKLEKGKLTQQAVFRIGVILAAVIVVFGFSRQLAIPDSFGQYGRYRGDSVSENAAKEVTFAASNETCKACHNKEYMALSGAEHTGLNCQSCHPPGAAHSKKPKAESVAVKGDQELCASCHRKMAGRSDGQIATVKPLTHSGGVQCTRCHDPHNPLARLGGKVNEL